MNETTLETGNTVEALPHAAFRRFTEEMARWWPAAYTWSGDSLTHIAIEPREGGRCFERGPDEFELPWGRVLACEPPHMLAFTWQINPDRTPQPDAAKASQVSVTFAETDGGGTRVHVIHDAFARHGDAGAGYCAGMASPQGWPYLLERLAKSFAA